MALTLIVGNPGAGKSYSGMHLCILPAIKAMRPVYTNIPLRLECIKEEVPGAKEIDITSVPSDELTPQILRGLPGGTLIVIDELWRYWPADLKKPLPDDEAFFAEHRHRVGRIPGIDGLVSQDIVILTQDTTDVPRFIRSRVAATFIVTKLTAVGAESRFRVDRYSGCVSSMRPPKSKLVSSSYGTYSSDVWRYYLSHTKSDNTGGVELSTVETGATRNHTVFTSPAMIALYVLFAVVMIGFLLRLADDRPFLGSSGDPVAIQPEPEIDKREQLRLQRAAEDDAKTYAPVYYPQPSHEQSIPEVAPTGPFDGWWITGTAVVGEQTIVMVTNGDKSKNVRAKKGACADDGVLSCKLAGSVVYNVPLSLPKESIYMPPVVRDTAEAFARR